MANSLHISVLIVTYNQESYISKAIEGVLLQNTEYSYEILIGEDCSTDQTFTICKKFEIKFPDKIRIIRRESNYGLIQNQLDLIRKSSGKYIAFCEGDDYWIDKYKLQKQVKYLEKNKSFGLVYTNYYELINNKISKRILDDQIYLTGNVLNESFYRLIPMTLTICFKIELLSEDFYIYMNDLQFKTFDFPMCLYLSAKTEFGFLNDYTAVYRYHANQVTSTSDPIKRFEFGMSHVYMRKKFVALNPKYYYLLEGLRTTIAAEILESSFRNNHKKKYGIIAYRYLQKHNPPDLIQKIKYWTLKAYINRLLVRFIFVILKKLNLYNFNIIRHR